MKDEGREERRRCHTHILQRGRKNPLFPHTHTHTGLCRYGFLPFFGVCLVFSCHPREHSSSFFSLSLSLHRLAPSTRSPFSTTTSGYIWRALFCTIVWSSSSSSSITAEQTLRAQEHERNGIDEHRHIDAAPVFNFEWVRHNCIDNAHVHRQDFRKDAM